MISKLEQVIEVIGQAIFDYFPDRNNIGIPLDKEDEECNNDINTFISLAEQSYIIVTWPEVQDLMEEEWFDEEAILDVDAKFGSSAYFIPLKRLL